MKKYLKSTITYLIIIILIMCTSYNSYSKVQNVKQEILDNISLTYNSHSRIKSKFIQEDSLGKQTYGWFIFDKNNGKARIEYSSLPLRIIINNNSVMIEQIDLKEKSFSPLIYSPFKFIINNNINLNSPELTLSNFTVNKDNYSITIEPKQKSFNGTITLCFNKSYHLIGWQLDDELGNKTNFILLDTEYLKNKIPASVFNTHRVKAANYNDFK